MRRLLLITFLFTTQPARAETDFAEIGNHWARCSMELELLADGMQKRLSPEESKNARGKGARYHIFAVAAAGEEASADVRGKTMRAFMQGISMEKSAASKYFADFIADMAGHQQVCEQLLENHKARFEPTVKEMLAKSKR